VRADTIFTRGEDEMEQRVGAYFSSRVFDIDGVQQLDLNDLISDLSQQVENFNSRGSGYVLDRITKFIILITKYRPLCGSTFIPTFQWLVKKRCVINVKNVDECCFLWAILSAPYPVENHSYRVSSYRQHEGTLNVTGLTFPMPVKNVPTFEKLNPDISINVFCKGDEGGYVPLYVSKERNRRHHVNLFLLEGKDEHGNDL